MPQRYIDPIKVKEINWDDLHKGKFFLYGTGMFLGVRFTVYPFSLIKTRLQLETKTKTTSTRLFFHILRHEGIRALYQGFPVTAAGAVPAQIIYLTGYETTKKTIKGLVEKATPETSERTRDLVANLGGGMAASICSQSVVVPIDIISQTMMVNTRTSNTSSTISKSGKLTSAEVVRDILRVQGPSGLYRGFLASILTYSPSSGVWWSTYSLMRKLQPSTDSLLYSGLCGGVAGCVSGFTVNPLDLIKTKLQTDPSYASKGIVGTVSDVWRADGIGGFYRGVTARMMNSCPVSVMMIVSYELVKRLSKLEQ